MGMKAQYKIMQMVFMVLFIFLFFMLVGIFLINSQSQGIKESAENLKRIQTISLIESLANSPEFSCGGTNSWCVDKDKLSIMSGELGAVYYDFWQIASIEVLTIYPNNNTEIVECTAAECNYYKVYDNNQSNKETYFAYISLCEQQTRLVTECELSKLILGVKNV